MTKTLTLSVLCLLCGSLCLAQTYRCDWSVVGVGGGEMASSAYKCNVTAGQTAAGVMTCPDFWALVGFWVPEGQTGVQEEGKWPRGQVPKTRLDAPIPNPARSHVAIRYSLSADGPASLAVHDIAGRVVRQLLASSVRRGAYRVAWDGKDGHSRTLANGIYFLKFAAGDFRQTEKLVLQR